MAKNKNNKRQQNDTEFSEEVLAKNVKRAAQNAPSVSANENSKQ